MVVLVVAVCAAKKMKKMAQNNVVSARNLIYSPIVSPKTRIQLLTLTSSLLILKVTILRDNFLSEAQLETRLSQ